MIYKTNCRLLLTSLYYKITNKIGTGYIKRNLKKKESALLIFYYTTTTMCMYILLPITLIFFLNKKTLFKGMI